MENIQNLFLKKNNKIENKIVHSILDWYEIMHKINMKQLFPIISNFYNCNYKYFTFKLYLVYFGLECP